MLALVVHDVARSNSQWIKDVSATLFTVLRLPERVHERLGMWRTTLTDWAPDDPASATLGLRTSHCHCGR